ncbi:amino acid permease [Amycolatopsis cynarae]|uniref:Amino acid permease n=1 Tax=Amycolatopsis cynarae TaxID=2995223 RepID=A0ABY7BB85_9PSEU|nr:amino acid permease [Amycolatopsis sp. HUAS 11-8]WAL69411.1 amino acid permease [Amycolatopsis sp. HUAS 11-8]
MATGRQRNTSDGTAEETTTGGGRARRVLSTRRVVFLVIAAAAPMAAIAGNAPLAMVRGNGISLPAAYVVAAVVLLCFAAGYSAMSKRVVNNGAFYVFVARGLGKPAGIATGYVAALGYLSLTVGMAAVFGYFTSLVFAQSGVDIPWGVFTAIGVVVVAAFGHRSADVSARFLGILMALEFAVLFVLDVLVVGHQGTAAFPPESFSAGQLFGGSLGIALMFAFTSFVGFESAALYGEETEEPARSIPRALYISVISIAVFYVLTAWIVIGGAGGTAAPERARKDLGNLVFTLAQQYGGSALLDASAVLLCTSVLASWIALHNAASRYLFALGWEQVAPRPLGRYHPAHRSPHVASALVTAVTVGVVGVMGLAGADPYEVIASAVVGMGTLSIVLVQAFTALSVMVFLRGRGDRRPFSGVIAPVVGALGLGTAFVLASVHYAALTGTDNVLVNAVPLLIAVTAVAGVVAALRLRARRPLAYTQLAGTTNRHRPDLRRADERPAYTRRYCIVGAGPSGMIMARTLLREGVPFDWYERNPDFGGIWDPGHEGSPMYESCHFISSKYTSGFYGAPMPPHFPDYPGWREIRDYIRDFGRQYDLYRHVRFGTEVTSAEPVDGDRWRVTLSDGTVREYDGLICCPGVTWHPNQVALPGQDTFTGTVRHSATFRDGLEFRGRRVLIVGAGNSGVDIACDAARHADAAYLSVRRGYRFVPKHIAGLPTDALLTGKLDPPKGLVLSSDVNAMLDAFVGDLTRLGLPAPDHDALASHPIMNTQVLHHLAHGDLVAKPDVVRLTATGVVFADGSEAEVDEIILATGYEYRMPFLDPGLLQWKHGHPQLYLNIFSRELDSLYVLGFVEFADAAYKRFEEMAQLILIDINARETGVRKAELTQLKRTDTPDLRGGVKYVDSPRHTNYVERSTYMAYLAQLRDRFGWHDVDDHTYDDLRAGAASSPAAVEPPKETSHV